MTEMLKDQNKPLTVKDAVDNFMNSAGKDGYDYDSFLAWLKKHPEEITEAALQLKDRFRQGDNTGLLLTSFLLQKALVPDHKENLEINASEGQPFKSPESEKAGKLEDLRETLEKAQKVAERIVESLSENMNNQRFFQEEMPTLLSGLNTVVRVLKEINDDVLGEEEIKPPVFPM